ncbi:50S ribosomal protein L4 [Candidatus Daviesbacteria bacterium]|nr:50S ribosomal protein L4 [Candidatus Daviesbacteria bacterium]
MPVKKKVSKVKTISSSLREADEIGPKQSNSDNFPAKIASSKTPRNDKKEMGLANLSIPVYSLAGNAAGAMTLPKEIFGAKVNKQLLSQAIRVYATNQKDLPGSTKTRGEVEGSTAKIFRQKGTGRARHGAIRAPIFVGGGIALGPKPRKVRLSMPQKMKKAALLSALSAKAADKQVVGLTGVDKASGKTKEIAKLLTQLNSKFKVENSKLKSALIVIDGKADNVVRAVRNIPGISILPANLINAYEVLKHEMLLITKEAVNVILGMSETRTSESGKEESGRAPLARLAEASAKRARMTIKKGEQK